MKSILLQTSIEIDFPNPEDIFDLFDNQEVKDLLRLFNNRLGEVLMEQSL